ncbi:MAG: G5 domain-containing protein [bacterium]
MTQSKIRHRIAVTLNKSTQTLKINTIINTLQKIHFKFKNTYLVFFSLAIILASFASQKVMGEGVVSSVTTNIKFITEEKTTNFTSNENTIQNALIKQGIKLDKNDLTNPELSTHLIGGDVIVKLIPARPVLINDNGQSWVGKSAYKNTSEILGQLGIAVDKVDIVNTELILDPVTDNMAGQKINIKRAPVFTIFVDAKEVLVHSWKKLVSDILAEGSVVLNQNDTVSTPLDSTAPVSGQLEITRVNYADVEENTPVEYEEITENSYEMYKGQSKVTQNGVNGSNKQIVHVVYHNGVEVSRDVASSVVTLSPQNKITIVGVKPYGMDVLWPYIVGASQRYGVSADDMVRVMLCESHGDVDSGRYNNAKYKGLFQWDSDSTMYSDHVARAGFPGAGFYDPEAHIYATALRVKEAGYHWYAWGRCSVG